MQFLDNWVDPYPAPVIQEHDGIHVVRDDLIDVGTKARALDALVGHDPAYEHVTEWVFGSSPAHGYGQISFAEVCKRYNKTVTLFQASRQPQNRHDYQKRALALGANIEWVNPGYLSVTQKRAKDYAEAKPYREVLPIGLEHDTIKAAFVKIMQSIDFEPTDVWSVGSSGCLNRCLQAAFPNAQAYVVQVGHKMKPEEIGNAIKMDSHYKFSQNVKEEHLPPFPSALNYDAKAWHIMQDYYNQCDYNNKKILFWNVGA